jgi:hypothetical protein
MVHDHQGSQSLARATSIVKRSEGVWSNQRRKNPGPDRRLLVMVLTFVITR